MRTRQKLLFFILGAASVVLAIIFFRFGKWVVSVMDSVGMERVTEIGIEKHPDQLAYVIGKDTELDLSGGIMWVGRDGIPLTNYDMQAHVSKEFEIVTDADFTKEGVYMVTLTRGDNMSCSFPIQVISPDYVE